jgi:hypothetical protein
MYWGASGATSLMGGYKSVIVKSSPDGIDTYIDVSIDGVWIGYWIY